MNISSKQCQLIGLSALCSSLLLDAEPIDTSITTPDVFDGLKSSYIYLNTGDYIRPTLGANSVSAGGSATGDSSIALGGGHTRGYGSLSSSAGSANGNYSISFSDFGGTGSNASYSMAIGESAIAEASDSFAQGSGVALGYGSTALSGGHSYGDLSFSQGIGSVALGLNTVVFGRMNDYGLPEDRSYSSIGSWLLNQSKREPHHLDHLFVIGNGQDGSNRSNAMVVYNSGEVDFYDEVRINGSPVLTADSTHIQQNTFYQSVSWSDASASSFHATAWGSGDSSGEYSTAFGSNTNASGNFSTAGGVGTTASGSSSTSFGLWTISSGQNSTALGFATEASGIASLATGSSSRALGKDSAAFGNGTQAVGDSSFAIGSTSLAEGSSSFAGGKESFASASNSFAFGLNAEAYGQASIAMGGAAISSGYASVAMGSNVTANGNYSTAFGVNTRAEAISSTTLGTSTIAIAENSVALGAYNLPSDNDLFVVGNGTSYTDRSNALEIKKDGTIIINKPQGDVSMGIFGSSGN